VGAAARPVERLRVLAFTRCSAFSTATKLSWATASVSPGCEMFEDRGGVTQLRSANRGGRELRHNLRLARHRGVPYGP